MVIRADTIKQLVTGFVNAKAANEPMETAEDFGRIIRRSTITDEQREKIVAELEKEKAKVAEMEKIVAAFKPKSDDTPTDAPAKGKKH